MAKRIRGLRRDRGSATVEVLILTPALLLVINLAVVTGRVAMLHAVTRETAQAAARAATMARTSGDADKNVSAYATALNITNGDAHCSGGIAVADASAFDKPLGTTGVGGYYAVTVTCTLTADQYFPIFGDLHESATAYSPLDPYRCRGLPAPAC